MIAGNTSTTSSHASGHRMGSNLTSRFGMNDNVAMPEDEGTTVVGGGFPSRHTADEYVGPTYGDTGREIHGRGTTGEHFAERTGAVHVSTHSTAGQSTVPLSGAQHGGAQESAADATQSSAPHADSKGMTFGQKEERKSHNLPI